MVKRCSQKNPWGRIFLLVLFLHCLLWPVSGALAKPYKPFKVEYNGDPGDGVLSPTPEDEQERNPAPRCPL